MSAESTLGTTARRAAPLATRIIQLIAAGEATTRTELCAVLGAPPSTISSAIGALRQRGLVVEQGVRPSTGGRPQRVLRVGRADDYALAADLGVHHARVGLVHAGGEWGDAENIPFDMAAGPQQALAGLCDALTAIARDRHTGVWQAVGVSIPGPVRADTGTVTMPSRMPGWNGFAVKAWLERRLGLPVAVDNDANCMALAEYAAEPARRREMILVKAGSAIGTGIVIGGEVYRGATGAAGDITHVRIAAAGDRPCSCGNTGCLETIASGLALVDTLRADRDDVHDVGDVVRLTSAGDPAATGAVRRAGGDLGEVLAANVNFFNPAAVVLGGALAQSDPFMAAVRSRLYEACHPLSTRELTITRSRLGENAGFIGAGRLALDAAVLHTLTTALSEQ